MKLKEIKEIVEQKLDIKLTSPTRKREFVYARSVYFKLARTHTGQPLSAIGNQLKKDHATVLHGIKIFDRIIAKYEPEMYSKYVEIDNELHVRLRTHPRYSNPASYYKEKAVNYALQVRALRHQINDMKKQIA